MIYWRGIPRILLSRNQTCTMTYTYYRSAGEETENWCYRMCPTASDDHREQCPVGEIKQVRLQWLIMSNAELREWWWHHTVGEACDTWWHHKISEMWEVGHRPTGKFGGEDQWATEGCHGTTRHTQSKLRQLRSELSLAYYIKPNIILVYQGKDGKIFPIDIFYKPVQCCQWLLLYYCILMDFECFSYIQIY